MFPSKHWTSDILFEPDSSRPQRTVMRFVIFSLLAVLSTSYASIIPLEARVDPIVVICPRGSTSPSQCLSIDIPNTNCINFDGALFPINQNVGTVTLQPGTICAFHQ